MPLVVHERAVWTFCVACCALSLLVLTTRALLYKTGYRLRQRFRFLRCARAEQLGLFVLTCVCASIHLHTGLLLCLTCLAVGAGAILGSSRMSVYRITVAVLVLCSVVAPPLLHRYVRVLGSEDEAAAYAARAVVLARGGDVAAWGEQRPSGHAPPASLPLWTDHDRVTRGASLAIPLDEWCADRLSLPVLSERVLAHEEVQWFLDWTGLRHVYDEWSDYLAEETGRRVWGGVRGYAWGVTHGLWCVGGGLWSGVRQVPSPPGASGHSSLCSAALWEAGAVAGGYVRTVSQSNAAAMARAGRCASSLTQHAVDSLRRWGAAVGSRERVRDAVRGVRRLPMIQFIRVGGLCAATWLHGGLVLVWHAARGVYAVYSRTTLAVHLLLTTLQSAILFALLYAQYRRRVRRGMAKSARTVREGRAAVVAWMWRALAAWWLGDVRRHPSWMQQCRGMMASMRTHHAAMTQYLFRHAVIFSTLVGLHVLPFTALPYRLILHMVLPWVSSQTFLSFFVCARRTRRRYRPELVALFVVKVLLASLLQYTVSVFISSILRDVVVSVGLLSALVGALLLWPYRLSTARGSRGTTPIHAMRDSTVDALRAEKESSQRSSSVDNRNSREAT